MNRKELEELIIGLNYYLSKHASKFDIEKTNFEFEQNVKLKFENERTMAALSNYFLDEYFKNHNYEDYHLSINELQICDFFADAREIEIMQQNVGGKVIKNNWKYCSVDGYFKVSNLVSQNVNHLFVEYKVQDKISFINLATDYLKFKIYTNNHKSNCIFAYVVFNKGNLNSPIVEQGKEFYKLLSRNITSEQILNTNVYLYMPPKPNDGEMAVTNEISKNLLRESYARITAIKEIAQQIEDVYIVATLERNEYNDTVLDGLHKFNSKVIKSRLVRENFSFIKALWDAANKAKKFDSIENIFEAKKGSKKFIEEVIEEGSKYLRFFEEFNKIDKKVEAENDGLRASYYSSFYLLVFLEYFNKNFNIGIANPKFGSKHIGRGKNAKTIDYNDIAENETKKIDEKYKKDIKKDEKMLKLAYCVLHFITDLYPLIYDINSQNRVIDEKGDLKVEKLKLTLSNLYKQFAKEFGYSTKFVYEDLGTDKDPFSMLISNIVNKIN